MSKQIFAFFLVLFFCSSLAFAATQTNQKDQNRTQTQKRDGSCGIIELNNGQSQHLAADQTRTRKPSQDRKKDRDCKTSFTEDEGLIISADQTKARDRKSQKDQKRDGSCG
jgi:hypothetical protein